MNHDVSQDSQNKQMFLLFRIGDELFGTPVAGIKEVIPFVTPQKVPNTKNFYLGVVNLNGATTGVVDFSRFMNEQSGYERTKTPRALLVFDSTQGSFAVAADGVETFCRLDVNDIDCSVQQGDEARQTDFLGVARVRQGMARLYDLPSLFGQISVARVQKEGCSA